MIGHAPKSKNITPPAKLIPAMTPMTASKPVPLSERCGVNSAENRAGSLCGASGALLSLIGRLYRVDGAQDDPVTEKEIAEIRQAEAVVRSRSRGGVPPFQEGQTRADHRTQLDQPLYVVDRGGALRAGDRRRRQQGDARVVHRGEHAGEDGGARRG